MTNVIDLEAIRNQRLEELTRRALRLPRYRRLAIIVTASEMLRGMRRQKAAAGLSVVMP